MFNLNIKKNPNATHFINNWIVLTDPKSTWYWTVPVLNILGVLSSCLFCFAKVIRFIYNCTDEKVNRLFSLFFCLKHLIKKIWTHFLCNLRYLFSTTLHNINYTHWKFTAVKLSRRRLYCLMNANEVHWDGPEPNLGFK